MTQFARSEIILKEILIVDAWQFELPQLNYIEALGTHLIIDLFDCEESSMECARKIKEIFNEAANCARCNIVTDCYHEFEPFGVSGVTVISESHFTYHGWNEHGYAAVDLFYCGKHVEIGKAINTLVDFFMPKSIRITSMPRGILI